MGLNGPVRCAPAERHYPITAMAAYTSGNIVDVEGFFRDHNAVPTKIILSDGANTTVTVDCTLVGQDGNHHYPILLLAGIPHELAVKSIHLLTSTQGAQFIIAGINP